MPRGKDTDRNQEELGEQKAAEKAGAIGFVHFSADGTVQGGLFSSFLDRFDEKEEEKPPKQQK